MKVKIEFSVDGASFEDDFHGEVMWTLRKAAEKLFRQRERQGGCICTSQEADDILMDVNGNRIGTVALVDDQEESD